MCQRVGHALHQVGGDRRETGFPTVQQHARFGSELVERAQFLGTQVGGAQHEPVDLRRQRTDRVEFQALVALGIADEHRVAHSPGPGLDSFADLREEGVEEIGNHDTDVPGAAG